MCDSTVGTRQHYLPLQVFVVRVKLDKRRMRRLHVRDWVFE
jgi:hypothetical protein